MASSEASNCRMWTQQPQPKCGFILVGTDGSIASYDYDDHVTLQTRANTEHVKVPLDKLPEGRRAPVEYVLARLADGAPITGPLDPAFCLIGQRIIDSALLAATEKRTVPLLR